MPKLWWTPWLKRSNGYFGSEKIGDGKESSDSYRITPHNRVDIASTNLFAETWFFFQTKPTWTDPETRKLKYTWYKFNVFSRWDFSTKQTKILVFNPHKDIKADILSRIFNDLPNAPIDDPFKVHVCFLEYHVHLQNDAVWAIRDLVRDTEKKRDALYGTPDVHQNDKKTRRKT